jgi:hypothetical protein
MRKSACPAAADAAWVRGSPFLSGLAQRRISIFESLGAAGCESGGPRVCAQGVTGTEHDGRNRPAPDRANQQAGPRRLRAEIAASPALTVQLARHARGALPGPCRAARAQELRGGNLRCGLAPRTAFDLLCAHRWPPAAAPAARARRSGALLTHLKNW